jgi:hypothetical protein
MDNTFPARPTQPTLANPDHDSLEIDLSFGANGNPPNILYALRTTANPPQWVQTDGSLGDTPLYRTLADWGSPIRIGPLQDLVTTAFVVVAYDPDGGLVSMPSSASGAVVLPVELDLFNIE